MNMHCRLIVGKKNPKKCLILVVLVNTVKRGQDHCFLHEQEVVNVFANKQCRFSVRIKM